MCRCRLPGLATHDHLRPFMPGGASVNRDGGRPQRRRPLPYREQGIDFQLQGCLHSNGRRQVRTNAGWPRVGRASRSPIHFATRARSLARHTVTCAAVAATAASAANACRLTTPPIPAPLRHRAHVFRFPHLPTAESCWVSTRAIRRLPQIECWILKSLDQIQYMIHTSL
jgi:hypothetical protein